MRYYLWATSEFEKEIQASFPTLRLFKSGGAWKTFQFMLNLPKSEQLVLARSLLKRFHQNAVKSLGETCSAEEEALRTRRDTAFSNIVSIGKEIRARKNAGEPIKVASKRQLRKIMTAEFKAAFGSECIDLASVDEEPDLSFKMKRAGWLVNTFFDFGRKELVLRYAHNIVSEQTFPYRNARVAMVMGWWKGRSDNRQFGLTSR